MTALRPGQSPPPVRTPTRMAAQYPGRFDRSTSVRGVTVSHGMSATWRSPRVVRHGEIEVACIPWETNGGYRARVTFSMVARSADGESWGVAVSSKFLGVGAAVPAAVAGIGAVATQAWANVAYKGLALAHLDEGATAQVALDRLLEEDDGRDHRQAGIVDCDGGAATYTGPEWFDLAAGAAGPGVVIQGNILTGPE